MSIREGSLLPGVKHETPGFYTYALTPMTPKPMLEA